MSVYICIYNIYICMYVSQTDVAGSLPLDCIGKKCWRKKELNDKQRRIEEKKLTFGRVIKQNLYTCRHHEFITFYLQIILSKLVLILLCGQTF